MQILNIQINELEEEVKAITKSPDALRRHEANNMLQLVWMAKEELNEGSFLEADEILHQVKQRVVILMDGIDLSKP